jgi:DNA-directed RNA polymerase specialized sigma24 family protein
MSVTSPLAAQDPTRLAVLAQDARQPEALREQARRGLALVIHHIARRVGAGAGQAGQDLRDEALSHVLRHIGRFNAAGGRFVAWCRRVLTNRLIDLLRRAESRRAEALRPEAREDRSAGLRLRAFEVTADLAAPFSPADLARVCAWAPLDRVVLLSLGLLWRKVPGDVWERTVRACGLEPPFPPGGFGEWDTREERGRILASALGWTPNRLAQRVSRGRRLLRALDFVRDMQGGERPAR